MVTETLVEQVVQALARGEAVAAVARAYGLDRKTVRTWRQRGAHRPRAVVPLRQTASPKATVRFETAPGAQAQVDFGQVRVWIDDVPVAAQIFVMTLGYSRRCYAVGFPRQRVREWLAGPSPIRACTAPHTKCRRSALRRKLSRHSTDGRRTRLRTCASASSRVMRWSASMARATACPRSWPGRR